MLALLMLISCFTACGGDDEDDDDVTPDDFNGSIADTDNNDKETDDSQPSTQYVPTEGSADAVIEIYTANDLITKLTRKGTFILKADIDLTDVNYKPFGNYMYPFEGKLIGEGHKIRGLKITEITGESVGPAYITYKFTYSGLFGATKNAEISDLTIEGAEVSYSTSTEYCYALSGILAGYMIDTKVTDCNISGKVSAVSKRYYAYSGAVCAMARGGSFTGITVDAEVVATDSDERALAGGLIAYVFKGSKITDCASDGNVKAVANYGVAYCGGLVAYTREAVFTVCKSEADVYAEVLKIDSYKGTAGSATAGGLFGLVSSESDNAKAKLIRCYSLGNTVTAKGNSNTAYVGGIAARVLLSDITDCYSRSDVNASSKTKTVYVGTAFGSIEKEYKIKGCFGYGNVSAEHTNVSQVYIGGFCGYPIKPSEERVTNCAYNVGATFTINGEAAPAIGPSALPLSSGMFTLAGLKNALQWKDSEWVQNGMTLIPVL